jgi:hypothetical protein
MLILCYGMPKSGSTLAFELVRGMLRSAGCEQETFINDERDEDELAAGGLGVRNYANLLTVEKIKNIMTSIGTGRKICVKTHSALPHGAFGRLEQLQADREIQVIASYRDPREICLSLMDAAKKAKKLGLDAFARQAALEQAQQGIERRIGEFRTWGALKGTLRLDYDTVAFLPEDAMGPIEAALDIKSDRAAAKHYAFNEAYTQKNKAKRGRYRSELSAKQNAEMLARFGEFIRRVCGEDDQKWFDECRAALLKPPESA